jgi:hypothetical protein
MDTMKGTTYITNLISKWQVTGNMHGCSMLYVEGKGVVYRTTFSAVSPLQVCDKIRYYKLYKYGTGFVFIYQHCISGLPTPLLHKW